VRQLLLALAFGLAASAARAEAITTASWGCQDLETVERMNEAIIAGDRGAAETILDGDDCVWWAPGTHIELIDRYPDWDLVCVARPGSDRCYWTDREDTDIAEE
jgi:hypothetical protein